MDEDKEWFESATVAQVKKDRHRDTYSNQLAKHAAEGAELANKHRKYLFNFVLWTVATSLVMVIAGVGFLGLGVLKLETPVAVAFISAVAVQSFILIGFLAQGLFGKSKTQPSKSGELE